MTKKDIAAKMMLQHLASKNNATILITNVFDCWKACIERRIGNKYERQLLVYEMWEKHRPGFEYHCFAVQNAFSYAELLNKMLEVSKNGSCIMSAYDKNVFMDAYSSLEHLKIEMDLGYEND